MFPPPATDVPKLPPSPNALFIVFISMVASRLFRFSRVRVTQQYVAKITRITTAMLSTTTAITGRLSSSHLHRSSPCVI